MFTRLLAHWTRLRRERDTRWATEAHHCVACGVAFGPDLSCRC